MKEIYHCFWVHAPMQKVYWALTDPVGLTGWWTKKADVQNEMGGVTTFRFQSGAFNKMRITNLEPNKIEWECVDGHEEWIGTQILFELRDDEGSTKVCFSHFGWQTQSEYTGECSFHWAYYLNSLKKLCETGQGMPNEGI